MQLRTTEIAKRIYSYGAGQLSASYGPLASRLQALRSYLRRLDQTNQAYAIFGQILTADSDVVSDDILSLGAVSDTITDIFQNIEEDSFELISDGLSDMANILSNVDVISDPTAFTIVDGDNVSYKFSPLIEEIDGLRYTNWYCITYDSEGNIDESFPLLQAYDLEGEVSYRINNVVRSMNEGKYAKTLPALIESVATVATINDITGKVATLCTTGRANATTVYSSVSEHVYSQRSGVRKWATTMVSIFNEAGLSGVVNYLLRSLHKVGNDLIDDDGRMVFTDNTALVPNEYIGTMLVTVATTIGALIFAFSGVIGKIIGGAIVLGSQAISWFSRTAWGNYNSETKAGLIDTDAAGETTVLPEAPYATVQLELPSRDFISLMDNNSGILVFEVPGGFLHVGPSSSLTAVRCEFHPHAFWTFQDLNCEFFGAIPVNSGLTTNVMVCVPKFSGSSSLIEQTWINGRNIGADYVMENNWSSEGAQVFSNDSDALLRKVVVRNTGLFYMWLSSLGFETQGSDRCLQFSRNNTSTGVFFGFQISTGGVVGFADGSAIHRFVTYACLPISLSFSAKYGLNGADMGTQTAALPTWTQIASAFASINNVAGMPTNALRGESFVGNQLDFNYTLSSGSWYPVYGSNFVTAKSFYVSTGLVWHIDACLDACNASNKFIGDADFISGSLSSGIYTPKYNRETYWWWVGFAAAATAIVVGATIVASVKIKKFINTKRASNAAKVEQAWAALTNDPSNKQLQSNYYKTAKKANLWQKVIGGTTFDTGNYWGGGSSANVSEGKLSNFFEGSDALNGSDAILAAICGSRA